MEGLYLERDWIERFQRLWIYNCQLRVTSDGWTSRGATEVTFGLETTIQMFLFSPPSTLVCDDVLVTTTQWFHQNSTNIPERKCEKAPSWFVGHLLWGFFLLAGSTIFTLTSILYAELQELWCPRSMLMTCAGVSTSLLLTLVSCS